jgi:hypothetical protein
MEQTNYTPQQSGQVIHGPDAFAAANVRTFLAQVFSYMALALVISGVMAWWFGSDMSKLSYLIDLETGSHTILGWVVMFAPLGLVFLMGGMVKKMSGTALLATFLVFATIMGISLSYIFLIYSIGSIANVFFITAVVFGTMAVAGYTTKTDSHQAGQHPHDRSDRHRDRILGEPVLEERYHELRGEHHRCGGIHRPHRLRCAEAQAHGRGGGEWYRDRPEDGAHGRPQPLPGLHQPVPDAAAPVRS